MKISLRIFKLLLLPLGLLLAANFLSGTSAFAQQDKIDSLFHLLKTDKDDTAKLSHLNRISHLYRFIGSFDSSLHYAADALRLANSLPAGMGKKGAATAYNNLGVTYLEQGNYPKALECYFNALKINEELGDKNGLATLYGNIGNVYCTNGDYPKGLEYYMKSMKLGEELGDSTRVAIQLSNIGIVHYYSGAYQKALEFYFRSMKIAEAHHIRHLLAALTGNIGNVYLEQAKLANNENGARDSLDQQALAFCFKALKMAEELENKNGITIQLGNIGLLYTDLKNYKEAEKYLLQSLAVAEEIGSLDDIKVGHQNLSLLYEKTNRPGKAFEHYKQYTIAKDSLFNEEKNDEITRKELNYEFEKKEAAAKAEHDKQIAVAEADKKKQNIITWSVGAGLLMAAIVLILVVRSLRVTRRQKAMIERQAEEIACKNKDLTDSIHYAQRIQSAILTSEQYLNEMFLPQGQVFSHFILYKPKDIVAGDFYWAYHTPDRKAIWIVADCTGHGVPGAFMSMIGNSLLNEIVVEKGIHEPDKILDSMRTGVIKSLGQSGGDKKKDGMDAALCCWDKASNKISFSGANNALWIIRNGEFFEIAPDNQPVGQHLVMNPFTKREFQLQQGDALYMFTDGYCDQFGGQRGKKFKYKPFKELLISIHDKSMPEQKQILNRTIDEWRGDLEQIDDICVFGVRV